MIPTIEERITRAHRLLTLILTASVDDDDDVDHEERLDAIGAAAREAREDLFWLLTGSLSVLKLPAPTTDQREAKEREVLEVTR